MKVSAGGALRFTLVLLTLVALAALFAFENSSEQQDVLSLRVSKRVREATDRGLVLISLEIENNGTVSVKDLEVYEYFPSTFKLVTNATIKYGDENITVPLPNSAAGSAAQAMVIITMPSRIVLSPGESGELAYWALAPRSGNYLIPTSLVWYSSSLGISTIRANIYSNGLMAHVPSEFEVAANRSIPYAVSVVTFVVTFAALRHLRHYFKRS